MEHSPVRDSCCPPGLDNMAPPGACAHTCHQQQGLLLAALHTAIFGHEGTFLKYSHTHVLLLLSAKQIPSPMASITGLYDPPPSPHLAPNWKLALWHCSGLENPLQNFWRMGCSPLSVCYFQSRRFLAAAAHLHTSQGVCTLGARAWAPI